MRDPADVAVGELRWVPLSDLVPNPWNPNAMDDEMFAKELESIRRFGMLDPIVARAKGSGVYEILDGEHRWKALGILDYTRAPVWDLGPIPDAKAKQITIVLNELRGQPEREKLGELLKDLLASEPTASLLEVLPFSDEAFKELVALPDFDWGALDQPTPASPVAQWVERTFRLPLDAAEVVDDALRKAKESEADDITDWQALELICADYLSGG